MINRKIVLAIATSTLLVSVSLSASTNRSPRMPNDLFEIGGGQLSLPPTKVIAVRDLTLGIAWNTDMACGKFDPKISISNQLNGLTEGFKDMMGNIIQSATSAVASLPGLALQKATPELYDMLQQGVLQGKMDFEWAETSCQQMQNVLLGKEGFPFENLKISAKYEAWAGSTNANSGDAIQTKKDVDSTSEGDAGVDWICGSKKGGKVQEPVETIRDVTIVGYNILFDRSNACSTAGLSASLIAESAIAAYWPSPVEASNWMVSVVGDYEIRTCEDCSDKLIGKPGKGLIYKYHELASQIATRLVQMVDGGIVNYQTLNAVSAPPSVMVTGQLISAIKKRDTDSRARMINLVAGDIAFVRLIEQSNLGIQMLRTGMKEPNVALQDAMLVQVEKSIQALINEINQLQAESSKRSETAGGAVKQILLLEEKSVLDSVAPNSGQNHTTGKTGIYN